MTEAKARSAVSTSAVIVGGVYLYRRLVESPGTAPPAPTAPGAPAAPTAPSGQLVSMVTPGTSTVTQVASTTARLVGFGPVGSASVGRFVVGFGFVYVVLALAVELDPDLAALGAWLVATGALLANGQAVASDISKQLDERAKPKSTATAAEAGTTATVNVGLFSSPGGGASMPTSPTTPATPRAQSV